MFGFELASKNCVRNFGLSLALSFSVLPAIGSGAFATDFEPVAAEAGVDIPQVNVNFGMRPYADNTFYIIAMKKGWFGDVGITIGPEKEGLKINDSNGPSLILNGQLDMASQYCPLMLPTYKSSDKLKCVGFTDTYLGRAILVNPKLKLKTFKEYIAEGLSFEDAIKATMSQMEGKTLVIPPILSNRPFTDAIAAFSGVKWNVEVIEDSKSLVLAKSGQIDFLNPEGAPVVIALEKAGWTRLIDIGDLFDHAPAGPDSPMASLVSIVGLGANSDYVNRNQNTVLRFMSVVWRTIDALKKDPSLYELQVPYLNSVAGLSLDADELKTTVDSLHPFTSFDDNSIYFNDESSILFYKTAWSAIIKEYQDNGVIPADRLVSPDDIVWASTIWQQMVDYRNKSKDILDELDSQALSGENKDLYAKAKDFYDKFDFLDAYRFASAISK